MASLSASGGGAAGGGAVRLAEIEAIIDGNKNVQSLLEKVYTSINRSDAAAADMPGSGSIASARPRLAGGVDPAAANAAARTARQTALMYLLRDTPSGQQRLVQQLMTMDSGLLTNPDMSDTVSKIITDAAIAHLFPVGPEAYIFEATVPEATAGGIVRVPYDAPLLILGQWRTGVGGGTPFPDDKFVARFEPPPGQPQDPPRSPAETLILDQMRLGKSAQTGVQADLIVAYIYHDGFELKLAILRTDNASSKRRFTVGLVDNGAEGGFYQGDDIKDMYNDQEFLIEVEEHILRLIQEGYLQDVIKFVLATPGKAVSIYIDLYLNRTSTLSDWHQDSSQYVNVFWAHLSFYGPAQRATVVTPGLGTGVVLQPWVEADGTIGFMNTAGVHLTPTVDDMSSGAMVSPVGSGGIEAGAAALFTARGQRHPATLGRSFLRSWLGVENSDIVLQDIGRGAQNIDSASSIHGNRPRLLKQKTFILGGGGPRPKAPGDGDGVGGGGGGGGASLALAHQAAQAVAEWRRGGGGGGGGFGGGGGGVRMRYGAMGVKVNINALFKGMTEIIRRNPVLRQIIAELFQSRFGQENVLAARLSSTVFPTPVAESRNIYTLEMSSGAQIFHNVDLEDLIKTQKLLVVDPAVPKTVSSTQNPGEALRVVGLPPGAEIFHPYKDMGGTGGGTGATAPAIMPGHLVFETAIDTAGNLVPGALYAVVAGTVRPKGAYAEAPIVNYLQPNPLDPDWRRFITTAFLELFIVMVFSKHYVNIATRLGLPADATIRLIRQFHDLFAEYLQGRPLRFYTGGRNRTSKRKKQKRRKTKRRKSKRNKTKRRKPKRGKPKQSKHKK